MLRKYYGFELNSEYLNMFESYLKKNLKPRTASYVTSKISMDEDSFREKIIDLRILKYGRVLAKKLKSSGVNISKIWIERSDKEPSGKYNIASAKYVLLSDASSSCSKTESVINQLISIPPLSKFGISADFLVLNDTKIFVDSLPDTELFVYAANNTHQYLATSAKKNKPFDGFIFSSIAVNVNEEIYRSSK